MKRLFAAIIFLLTQTAAAHAATYGPGNEALGLFSGSCTTTGTQVTTGDNWENTIETAGSGTVLLFRAGTYSKTTATLTVPAGVTLRNYNCETVVFDIATTINTNTLITPGSNVTIRGLEFQSTTHCEIARFDNATNVSIVNSNLYGGRNDGLRTQNGATNITVQGNNVRSGSAGTGGSCVGTGGNIIIFSASGAGATNVQILDNDIRGDWFGDVIAGDDVVAVEECVSCSVQRNLFRNIYNVENLLDIKQQVNSAFTYKYNYFTGPFLGTKGGQDQTVILDIGGITVGDSLGAGGGATHIIENNIFDGPLTYVGSEAKRTALAIGGGSRYGNVIVRGNTFKNTTAGQATPSNRIRLTTATTIEHNSFYRDGIRVLANSCATGEAQNVKIRNNIFIETRITDNTDACAGINLEVQNNIFRSVASAEATCANGTAPNACFERGTRTNNLSTDPLLVSPSGGDFRISSLSSPAVDSGLDTGLPKNGAAHTRGAFDPPRFHSCVVENATPNRVDVLFVNNVAPPVLFSGVTGIAIQVAAGDRVETAPVLSGTNIIQYTLTGVPIEAGQAVTWAATSANTITDSSLIGNSLNQGLIAILAQNCTNNVGAAPSTYVLTQTHFRCYGVPFLGGVLDPRGVIDVRCRMIKSGSIIAMLQVTCTIANCPTFAGKFQGSWDQIAWFNLSVVDPTAFDGNNVRFSGTNKYSNATQYPQQLYPVTGCLDATGLTPVAGGVERTGLAVPNQTLNQDECVNFAAMIDADSDITPGSILYLRIVNQSSTFSFLVLQDGVSMIELQSAAGDNLQLQDGAEVGTFSGTYVYGEIEVTDYNAGIVF